MNLTKNDIQKEALSVIMNNNRSTVALGTGIGKTYLGLQYLKYLQYFEKSKELKILIVTPKLSVMQSWKDEAIKFEMSSILKHTTFSTYLSLIKQSYDYDVIILDEVHNLKFSHDVYLKSISKNCKILGLTGTPPKRKDSEKGQMIERYCPVKFKYGVKEAVDDNILNNYKIYIHYINLSNDNDILVKYKGGEFKTSEVNKYTYWTNRVYDATSVKAKQVASIMRMKAMQGFKTKELYAKSLLDSQKDKCILFCNTQEQADNLCSHSYHSKNPDSEENLINFKENVITKLACVEQLSEGINIPNLKSGIIMHSFSGNSPKSSQRFGRLLRLNPNDTCNVHFLCYKNTVDESWIESALENLDQTKIFHLKN